MRLVGDLGGFFVGAGIAVLLVMIFDRPGWFQVSHPVQVLVAGTAFIAFGAFLAALRAMDLAERRR